MSVALVAFFLPLAALVLLAALLLAGVLSPVLTARAARISELAALQERGNLAATAMTAVESAGELTVSSRTGSLLADLDAADRRLAAAADRAAGPAAGAAGLNLAAMAIAVLGAVLIGIPATTAGTLAPVELAVVVLVPLAAFEATTMLPAAATQLVRSAGAARRIVELLDAAAAPIDGPSDDASQPDSASLSAPATGGRWRQDARSGVRGVAALPDPVVRARGLSCGWPGRPPVLEGLDLDAGPGRSVAVVGASGVGKTTLLLTLAGLLPARAGSVRIAGADPWRQAREDVSRSVVLTAEDAHVFETTVLENLRVARGDVDEGDARRALTEAGLAPWLAGLPEGLHTPLGAEGATISGGERRRLLVARALLSPAPLLLLDEPAEHLDAAAADTLVSDLLRQARSGERGVVLVTHRLSALGAADEVVLLGRPATPDAAATVLARGKHTHLAAEVPSYAWSLEQEQTESMSTAAEPRARRGGLRRSSR